jgi:hypothetical protein
VFWGKRPEDTEKTRDRFLRSAGNCRKDAPLRFALGREKCRNVQRRSEGEEKDNAEALRKQRMRRGQQRSGAGLNTQIRPGVLSL